MSETIPWRGHRRDCAYVVSPGPAPCACDHYELQDAAMVAAGLLPPKAADPPASRQILPPLVLPVDVGAEAAAAILEWTQACVAEVERLRHELAHWAETGEKAGAMTTHFPVKAHYEVRPAFHLVPCPPEAPDEQ